MTECEIPEVNFNRDDLLAKAAAETGLNNFGDNSFREPFNVLLYSLSNEANLNRAGRFIQYERVLNTLKNRLRQSEWVRLYPEILDEQISAPVVIVGLPRTGTTMLHRVLASDERFFAPLWYEVRNPAPFLDWDTSVKDERLTLAETEVSALLRANPEIAAIHPMDPLGADEDILLLEHSFYSTVPPAFCNTPSYSNWLFNNDNQPGYDYLKLQLQSLQWQKKHSSGNNDNKRWLLKTPHHLHFLDKLIDTFPDAKIISTHRDPIDTIPSICSFNYNLWITQANDVAPNLVGKQWSGIFATGTRHAMKVRQASKGQFIDISFKELLGNPEQTTRSIFNFIGVKTTSESLAAMQLHRDQNQRDSRPPHDYSLEDFGLTEKNIKATFAGYIDAFKDLI